MDIKKLLLKKCEKYEYVSICDFCSIEDFLDDCAKKLSSGATCLILDEFSGANYSAALKLRQLTSIYDALVLSKNRLDVAKIADFDGVVLEGDCDWAQKYLPSDKLILKYDDYKRKDEQYTIYKSKYLDFKAVKSPSGNTWVYAKRTNDRIGLDSAVVITTLVKIKGVYNFLFLKTSRPPLYAENKAKYCLESPAGLIADDDKNEGLIECAKKELKEEAGLIADKLFIEKTNCSTSSGLTSETLSYVSAICEEYDPKGAIDDGGIIVERELVDTDSVFSYFRGLNSDTSLASATVCGVYFALERIKEL